MYPIALGGPSTSRPFWNSDKTSASNSVFTQITSHIQNKVDFMKLKTFYYGAAFLCAATLAGCSTNTVVTLQDGTQYITKDVPDTKTKDGFYEFEDVSGKQVRIKADEVATVKEED